MDELVQRLDIVPDSLAKGLVPVWRPL